eukprot:gene19402-biopygen10628
MGIDVLHLVNVDLGITQRIGDAACSTRAIRRRRGHVVRITAHAETNQLGVDGCATGLRVLQLFEYQRTGTVGQNKTVTALVPRTAGTGRLVIAGRQRTGRAEAAHAQTAGGHLGTASDHHVGLVIGDIARRHADAVSARGARRGNGVVRPLGTQVDGQETGNHVDDRARHEER